MKFFLESYGCSLNTADSETIKGVLQENGFTESRLNEAELIIVNTCGVKEQTEQKILKRLKELNSLAEKEKKKLIAFGCLAKISPQKIAEAAPSAEIVPPDLRELGKALGIKTRDFCLSLPAERFKTFVSIIPVSRGCNSSCTYCCVKNARGKLQSHPLPELTKRFSEAVSLTPEIWLTAQDTAAYGHDFGGNLTELLEALLKTEGKFRVRLGMMNPHNAEKNFQGIVKALNSGKFFKFLHLPVQSGSDKILEKMNRKYSSAQFLSLVEKFREKIPSLTISTDLIVGFPGESEEDFQKSLALLKKAKPDVLNISRYGKRPNTVAAEIPGQLHGRIKKQRSRIVTELYNKLALEKNCSLVGKEFELLVTGRGPKGNFIGRTESYKPVVLKEDFLGKFVKVRITKAEPTYLIGEIL